MTRNQAIDLINIIGGNALDDWNNSVNFLVVGQQDYRVVGEDGMSSKQKKALNWAKKGNQIEVMSEDDFLRNI